MASVLVFDSDRSARGAMVAALRSSGHEVAVAESLLAARAYVQSHGPRILIVDGSDEQDGATCLVADARKTGTLVMVVSRRTEESACVLAFEAGADDFVVKPFSLREIVLRARALLRRSHTPSPSVLFEMRTLRIDRVAFQVSIGGRPAHLSLLEVKVLLHLADEGGRVVRRETLIERVWEDASVSLRVVDTTVRRLRAKLGAERHLLHTVRSLGYQLREPMA